MSSLNDALSQSTPIFHLKLWVLIAICIGILTSTILLMLLIWASLRRKSKDSTVNNQYTFYTQPQIPTVSKEITVDSVNTSQIHNHSLAENFNKPENPTFSPKSKYIDSQASNEADDASQCNSGGNLDRAGSSYSDGGSGQGKRPYAASPLVGLPELSHIGWGHWFTLRDLELATDRFSKENVIGEGGYGVVYRGKLINGTEVAVKRILNNVGQAEKEFRVEVEAIGHVRHKNLVRLLGYCVEGTHRMLVYEYVNNGNLEQWLHGAMSHRGVLTWDSRVKILLGTAKALAYLHEGIDPKVVHRDIKSSNILIDEEFSGKLSDFGLAKLLGSDKSYVSTRVMGTYGYVAPEYANTGMLNEKSDIYSFGVLVFEAVTGRDPIDYSRPNNEVNLVEWVKMIVGSKRTDEVVDPKLDIKPTIRALKRVLLVALRSVDPDADKRPKMSQIVQMLEAVEALPRERNRKSRTGSIDIESLVDVPTSSEAGEQSGTN
ncbi:putative receptor-like protein kinase At2g42960 isoform X2 [Carex rostrata]